MTNSIVKKLRMFGIVALSSMILTGCDQIDAAYDNYRDALTAVQSRNQEVIEEFFDSGLITSDEKAAIQKSIKDKLNSISNLQSQSDLETFRTCVVSVVNSIETEDKEGVSYIKGTNLKEENATMVEKAVDNASTLIKTGGVVSGHTKTNPNAVGIQLLDEGSLTYISNALNKDVYKLKNISAEQFNDLLVVLKSLRNTPINDAETSEKLRQMLDPYFENSGEKVFDIKNNQLVKETVASAKIYDEGFENRLGYDVAVTSNGIVTLTVRVTELTSDAVKQVMGSNFNTDKKYLVVDKKNGEAVGRAYLMEYPVDEITDIRLGEPGNLQASLDSTSWWCCTNWDPDGDGEASQEENNKKLRINLLNGQIINTDNSILNKDTSDENNMYRLNTKTPSFGAYHPVKKVKKIVVKRKSDGAVVPLKDVVIGSSTVAENTVRNISVASLSDSTEFKTTGILDGVVAAKLEVPMVVPGNDSDTSDTSDSSYVDSSTETAPKIKIEVPMVVPGNDSGASDVPYEDPLTEAAPKIKIETPMVVPGNDSDTSDSSYEDPSNTKEPEDNVAISPGNEHTNPFPNTNSSSVSGNATNPFDINSAIQYMADIVKQKRLIDMVESGADLSNVKDKDGNEVTVEVTSEMAQDTHMTRIYLKDYLELTYIPGVVANEPFIATGRRVRIDKIYGGKADIDNFGTFIDRKGNEISNVEKLSLFDVVDYQSGSDGYYANVAEKLGLGNANSAEVAEDLAKSKSDRVTHLRDLAGTEGKEDGEDGMVNTESEKILYSDVYFNWIRPTIQFGNNSRSSEKPLLNMADATKVNNGDVLRLVGLCVNTSMFKTNLYTSWINVNGDGGDVGSLEWWNNWLSSNGFSYRIDKDTLLGMIKDNFKSKMAEEGYIVFDLVTVAHIQDEMNEDRLNNIKTNLFTVSKLIGFLFISYSILMMGAWVFDVNITNGPDLLGKLSLNHWEAIGSVEEAPYVNSEGKQYMDLKSMILKSTIIMAIGVVLLFIDIVTLRDLLVNFINKFTSIFQNIIHNR